MNELRLELIRVEAVYGLRHWWALALSQHLLQLLITAPPSSLLLTRPLPPSHTLELTFSSEFYFCSMTGRVTRSPYLPDAPCQCAASEAASRGGNLGVGSHRSPLGWYSQVCVSVCAFAMDFEFILKVAEKRIKAALGKADAGKIYFTKLLKLPNSVNRQHYFFQKRPLCVFVQLTYQVYSFTKMLL